MTASAPKHGPSPAQGSEPRTGGTSGAGSGDDPVAPLLRIAHRPTLARRLVSWSSRPPGRLYLPACACIGLVLLYEDSVPGGHLPAFVLGMGGGAVLAAMGALRLGIAMGVARPMVRRYWMRWIAAPLVATAAIVLAVADIPLQGRVAASAEQLMEVRDTANSSTTVPMNGDWAGLYPLTSVGVLEDGTTLYGVQGAGLLNRSGLAYSPEPLDEGVFIGGHGNRVYEHITDGWYAWTAY
ncbi:hypothetical protein O4J56_15040 [Nocardiopsis sp. RSe5-2]|uniref:Uncharacterized protein n=1 Tax=Nocardiopsis endophytica TaxID=3018445 RepID=A0ABT4U5G5_9ACTN|nr:hypothetical protein [Nocardiopsis endophytica]MDA2811956.1 hypothetical protein [Nocardiopsis endophytica]